MRVFKWGNSLAIRLPRVIVDALKLRPGDEIEIAVAGTRQLEIARAGDRRQSLAELMKRARGVIDSGVPDLASNPRYLG